MVALQVCCQPTQWNHQQMSALREYNRKRDFSRTPEPKPRRKSHPPGQLLFVVQKHAARRLHYDLRLEFDGVLVSWAVPKGPSLDPNIKRLAVKVEDHPYDYGDFEGIIPEGEYGAGQVIVWDKGFYCPSDGDKLPNDSKEQMEARVRRGLQVGKLTFCLTGKKLKGLFTLIRLKRTPDQWLLLKNHDEHASPQLEITELDKSVISQKTIEDVRASTSPAVRNSARRTRSKATGTGQRKARKSRKLPLFSPMLASLATAPFSRDGWKFEPKLDGIRAIAYIQDGKVKLLSRRGNELEGRYPVLELDLSKHTADVILDGEIVALDRQGRPSFQLLQQRSGLTLDAEISQAERDIPIQYYVFDILYLNGPLLDLTLDQRKQLLRKSLIQTGTTRFVDFLGSSGEDAFRACLDAGLEGVMAKRLASFYEPGKRTRSWLKIKATRTAEFVICGYTPGAGSRAHTFGALVLADYDRHGHLSYAGLVGTGFTEKTQRKLLSLFAPLETKTCPLTSREARRIKAAWLQPQSIAEVKYAELTNDGKLRAPVFMNLRDDVAPEQTGPNPIVDMRS